MKRRLLCFLLILAIEIICFPLVSFASESIESDSSILESDHRGSENKDKIVDSNIEFNELVLEKDIEKNCSVSSEADGSFSIKNKKGLYTAAFKPKSGNGLLSFSQGNANLLISPLNPGSVSGSVYNNIITYDNIYLDTSIKYTLERSRLKEDIVVQKYTGISDFYFQLNVNNAKYEKKSNGEIHFFDPISDNPLFYMPKPYAIDKNGTRCDLVNMEISKKGLLTICVDPEWLKKAVYPVIIDPTLYLASSVKTSLGLFETYASKSGVSIVDTTYPLNNSTIKAIRLNVGANVPVITSNLLNLKTNTNYVLEFDYWADIDNAKFDVDLWPDDLPQILPIAQRGVQHYKWVFNSWSVNMNNAVVRFFNDRIVPNPGNIYITNIQLYEGIHSIYNIVNGPTEVGIFETANNKSGVSIVDTTYPLSNSAIKAIRLNVGANVPVIASNLLNLKTNTNYVLEFDYWADIDNAKFNVDLWPDDLPEILPIAQRGVQHYKWVFNSSSVNMNNAVVRFFNDRIVPNPGNIYITNIQLYEGIHSIYNIVNGPTEVGIFETANNKSGVSIVDTTNPLSNSAIKAIRLNVGANVPVIASNLLNLKTNTNYVLEFDYWADIDNAKFNVDLWPDDLPEILPIAQRGVQHYKWIFNSSSVNMNNAVVRFFNDKIVPNPGSIYITNIQLFEENINDSSPITQYLYDNLSCLNKIFLQEKTIVYQYDENGNLIRRAIN